MLTAVSTYAQTVTDADSAGKVLREAAAHALATPGGPASVEWPIDLQYAAQTIEAQEIVVDQPIAPATEDLSEALAAIASARRPVIWAGGGVARAGAELTELLDRWGAPLFTSNSGRGAVSEDHPRVIGNYATSPAGRALLADADLLVSLGTHFRSNETGDYALQIPTAHVQVDLDPAAPGRVFPASVPVVGDVAAFLQAVLDSA